MSAVEALAEVLRQGIHDYVPLSEERPLTADDPSLPDSMASALVAAIRSMPAEQVAELIDGKVEKATKTRWFDGSGSTFWDFSEAEEYAAKASTWGDGPVTVHPVIRVITPWLPLGVSPETNGEQK